LPETTVRGFGFPASRRIKTPSEFRSIYDQGNKCVGRFLVLWFVKSSSPHTRIGVVASKKVGNAVRRARAKRRLRELYRLNQHEICEGYDIVMVSRYGIIDGDWDRLRTEFLHLFREAGLLVSDAPLLPVSESEPPPFKT